ncbi:MAG: hypothetical protein NC131_15715 [Roseburia sp.]|nr:hypothetical protein [Roseburia sp.]
MQSLFNAYNEHNPLQAVSDSDRSRNTLCYSFKIYNDKITFTEYERHKIRYRYFNEQFKVDVETGELFPWNVKDITQAHKSFESSLSRTLSVINELTEKNVFTHFITFTFNRKYVDRKSAEKVHLTFKKIVKRLRYLYGDFGYLAVPEYHADGAVHYHCLFVFHGRRPRLAFKGYSSKGERLFEITDRFFKKDCYITVELIHGESPTWYLTKYITKGRDCPLRRRFSCSRNLNRSRLVRAVDIPRFQVRDMFRVARNRGFKKWTSNKYLTSYRYDLERNGGGSGARERAASPDSSILNIKGENALTTEEVFAVLLEDLQRELRLKRENVSEYEVNGKKILVGGKGQLAFLLRGGVL